MKVIFFSNVRTMSGAERVLLDFLRPRPALEAVIAAPEGDFLATCRREGLSVRRLRSPTELRRNERVAWPLMFAARYAGALVETTTLLVRERPDVLHANNFAAGIYAALSARIARVPMVWQIHDIFPRGSLEARVLFRLQSSARCILAVSSAVRDSLLGIGIHPEKIITILNAVDARFRFDPVRHPRGLIRSELQIPEEAVVITMIGQVTEHKGSGLMLDAVEDFFGSVDREVRIVIVGAAPPEARHYEHTLRRRVISSPRLRDRVIWLGYRDDVPELLADSDVVVNASLIPEAFGMTVLEGMAMAKIVVAPDVAGTAEIVEHESSGFLFRSGDARDLGQKLCEIVSRLDRLRDVRRRARDRALHDFDIELKSTATIDLYESIVDSSSRRKLT